MSVIGMFATDDLSLRPAQLRASEEWACQGNGLFFVFPRTGAGQHVFHSTTRLISPQDVLVVSGSAGGCLRAPKGGQVTFLYFRASREVVFTLLGAGEVRRFVAGADTFNPGQLYPARTRIASECNRLLLNVPRQPRLEHRSRLLQVVAAILSYESPNGQDYPTARQAAEEPLAHALRSLSVKEILDLSAEELAARLHCSRRHLRRLFDRYWGLSIADFKTKLRMLKAVALLRNPEMKIIRVAEETGFMTLSWFNACFKTCFGMSPGQWRKTVSRPIEGETAGAESVSHHCELEALGLCPWSQADAANSHSRSMEASLPGGAVSHHPKLQPA